MHLGKKLNERNLLIDGIRVVALFLMIVSHATMILNAYSIPVNSYLKDLANLVCFSLFLFGFGYGLGKKSEIKLANKKSLIRKLAMLYVAYGIISLSEAILKTLSIYELFELLIFVRLASYGEFLVSFGLYLIVFKLFKKQIVRISSNFKVMFFFGASFFILGTLLSYSHLLYESSISNYFLKFISGIQESVNIKAYSFPLLQYSIFLFLGIYYGKDEKVIFVKSIKAPLGLNIHKIAFIYLVASLFSLAMVLEFFRNFNPERWPPNICFILFNFLAFILIVHTIYLVKKIILSHQINFLSNNKIKNTLIIISSRSIFLVGIHIPILYLFAYFLEILGLLGSPLIGLIPILFSTMILFITKLIK